MDVNRDIQDSYLRSKTAFNNKALVYDLYNPSGPALQKPDSESLLRPAASITLENDFYRYITAFTAAITFAGLGNHSSTSVGA